MAETPILQNAYVYEIIVDDVARYVGKGTGDRVKDHIRLADRINRQLKVGAKVKRSFFYRQLARALMDGATVEHRIIAFGLTNEAAFALEMKEIASAPSYQLWNESPGGNGHSTEYLKRMWSDPERIERQRANALERWSNNPEWRSIRFAELGSREKQSAMVRAKWADPEYRAMQKAARSRPDRKPRVTTKFSEKRSLLAKQRWADPSFRARAIEGMKRAAASSPEFVELSRERMTRRWSDPRFRERMTGKRQGVRHKKNDRIQDN